MNALNLFAAVFCGVVGVVQLRYAMTFDYGRLILSLLAAMSLGFAAVNAYVAVAW